ncbi:MAG TPA: ABC transporter ATP-binding protein [Candidatus Latescibacteria bacterium]|nr:ABC transporter ATP-binding protein [Candidatus Latescibacterota bacterium]
MSKTILEAHDIHKSYTTPVGFLHVLRGVDLEVREAEIVAVVGPSGVGKSTLLHILGALDRPTKGCLWMDSIDVFSLSDDGLARFRNRTIGFVFQFHHLLPEFSALENVMMPALIAGRKPQEVVGQARELLARVGLEGRESHKPAELSGGELQRVAVVRSLINDPRIVLADEPSGNLDSANSLALHELIWDLSSSLKKSFVIATHNLELAAKADRIIKLADGKAMSG